MWRQKCHHLPGWGAPCRVTVRLHAFFNIQVIKMELGILTLSYECILPEEACETVCFCKTTLKVFVRKNKNFIVGVQNTECNSVTILLSGKLGDKFILTSVASPCSSWNCLQTIADGQGKYYRAGIATRRGFGSPGLDTRLFFCV